MAEFTLKEEHIELIANLNFKTCANTEYGDRFIPVIDRKRPFGNSGATNSVLEVLGCCCDGKGKYKKDDINRAEMLLIELPVALEIIVRNKTFRPGIYEVDEYAAYFNYKHMTNYQALLKPLKEIEETVVRTDIDAEKMEQMHRLCMNISGDDPYKIIDDLHFFAQDSFLEKAVLILQKHKAM